MVQAELVGMCCAAVVVCSVVTEQGGCGGFKAVQNLISQLGSGFQLAKSLLQRQTRLSTEWRKTLLK